MQFRLALPKLHYSLIEPMPHMPWFKRVCHRAHRNISDDKNNNKYN